MAEPAGDPVTAVREASWLVLSGEVAPGERRILLVELELEGIELAPQRLRLDRDLERRRSLRRRVGLAEGSRRAEKAGCQDEPDENLAHRSAPLRPIAPPPAI